MRGGWGRVLLALPAGAMVAGCTLTGSGDSASLTPGSLAASPVPAAAAPAPVSMGPLLDGPLGARLAEPDRDQAFKAETQALETGERRTWRGSRGTYGFVVPAGTAQAEGGECRSFTHTIYFAGRPQSGSGRGCRGADGSWRVTG